MKSRSRKKRQDSRCKAGFSRFMGAVGFEPSVDNVVFDVNHCRIQKL
jgi:hypothetical protein